MKLALAILALAFPCVCSASYVQTMTFSTGLGEFDSPIGSYTEDGITATGTVGPWGQAGTAHFDRLFTRFDSQMDFTTGSLFTPLSVMVQPLGANYCASCSGVFASGPLDDVLPYIWVSGYRSGSLVSTAGFYMAPSDTYDLLSLSFLGEIDMLRIGVKNFMDLGLAGGCGEPCGSMNIDDLMLTTSVPEPGTIALFAVALLGLEIGRRRARMVARH